MDETDDEAFETPVAGRRALSAAWLWCAITAAVAVSAGVTMLHDDAGSARAEPVTASRMNADWVDAVDPPKLFTLSTLSDAPLYRARRQLHDDWQTDLLESPGSGASIGPIQVVIQHGPGMRVAPRTLFVEAAWRAAERSLAITRFDQPFITPTRFGAMEVSPLDMIPSASSLSAAGAVSEQACLGFRLGDRDQHVHILGFFCGTGRARPDPAALACIVDGLEMSAADGQETADENVRTFFAKASGQTRSACHAIAAPIERRQPPARLIGVSDEDAVVDVLPKHRRRHAAARSKPNARTAT